MLGRTAVLIFFVATVTEDVNGANSGLRVSGTRILDGRGRPFVMRGINHPHSWFKNDADTAIPAIARTGANVVRIVLSDGQKYNRDDAASVAHLLALCQRNKLVAMLEVHDPTGAKDTMTLNRAADYYVSIAGTLRGLEDRVTINIANEWLGPEGGIAQTEAWAAAYRSILPRLRRAGLNHLLVVNAAGYGQNVDSILSKGRSIFQADPRRNTIFDVHMYEAAGRDAATVRRNIDSLLAIGVPFIVGEFSDSQGGKPVDYKTILSYCQTRSVGWIAWSWYGNDGANAHMNLATGPAGQLTRMGQQIVNGPYGIRATSKPVSTW